jgi:hypothetical protein
MSSDGKIQTAGGDGTYLFASTDYGQTWNNITSVPIANWESIAMSSDGKIQIAGNYSSYIYVSSDYGKTWTAKGGIGSWGGIAMSSDGKIQIATNNTGGSGKLYLSTDYGQTWAAKGSNGNWIGVAMSSDGKIMTAANSGGQLYVSYSDSVTMGNAVVANTANSTKACGSRFIVPIMNAMTGNNLANNMNALSGVDVNYTCVNCRNTTTTTNCTSSPGTNNAGYCQFNTTCFG